MKRLLAILAIAAAGVVAACSQGSTSSGGLETVPAVSIEAPSIGASEPASRRVHGTGGVGLLAAPSWRRVTSWPGARHGSRAALR